ncbi:hypothetical protein EVAR_32985_1 [Eumeta japonica]|uniref:Uncharacterized protein n=1 Tax=Eumeta variegata TaxID=151549 RepID=A0A4C1VST0_EUMVA|nr:hypothetical protein EVAR_32985_1 [Eumeta japonica]
MSRHSGVIPETDDDEKVTNNLAPQKSRPKYEAADRKYMQRGSEKWIKSCSESVSLTYFSEQSENLKPSMRSLQSDSSDDTEETAHFVARLWPSHLLRGKGKRSAQEYSSAGKFLDRHGLTLTARCLSIRFREGITKVVARSRERGGVRERRRGRGRRARP